MLTCDQLIQHYHLQPHPEGGFYAESYRATGMIPHAALPNFKGECHFSTAIYFLLPAGCQSSLHRIQSDELWHFYSGNPLTIVEISPQGMVRETQLGPHIENRETFQHVVPAGHWFGAYPNNPTGYSFVGCTVAPGFDFKDFTLASRNDMLRLFPHAQHVIERLTPAV